MRSATSNAVADEAINEISLEIAKPNVSYPSYYIMWINATDTSGTLPSGWGIVTPTF